MSSIPPVNSNTFLPADRPQTQLANSPNGGHDSGEVSRSSQPSASYNSLYSDVHGKVIQFLDRQDVLVNYAPVNRGHRKDVHNHYREKQTTIQIASHVANSFFSGRVQFPNLTHLTVVGADLLPLDRPIATGKINRLTFHQVYASTLTSKKILILLDKIPNLKGLTLPWIGGDLQFPPGQGLSDAARENLKNLVDLDLTGTQVHSQGLIEIFQCSTSFHSVNLQGQDQLSNALFSELVRSQGLAHLDLGHTNEQSKLLDYRILASCSSLKSFTPGKGITEEALLQIIKSNRGLTSLELGVYIGKDVVTDKVLQAIAEYLTDLEEIKLDCSNIVSTSGFVPIIQSCRLLRSLTLSEIGDDSSVAWEKLTNWRALRDLNIENSHLPAEFFGSLVSMTGLTSLCLNRCKGFLGESMHAMSGLTHLTSLNIQSIDLLSDDVVEGIINRCAKLDSLMINGCSNLTVASLDFIRSALTEKRSKLRQMDCSFNRRIPDKEYRQLWIDYPNIVVPISSDF